MPYKNSAKHEVNGSIGGLVRKAETDFISGGGTLSSKYVTTDLYEDINKIYAYLESKHTTGETDSMGREKPFFNIVIAARNIWYRATDIDRKNIKLKASNSKQVIPAFIGSIDLKEWMQEEDYGSFLNRWGLELATFNDSVVKFVESEGKLHIIVMPWNRLIVDSIDFANNPKIEILELTEAQLRKRKGYDKDMVEKLCNAIQARTLTDGQRQDNKNNYIKLFEVHGELPLSNLTGKEKDCDEYVQQMHVISFVAGKEKGDWDDYTLLSGREEKDPYMLTSLIPTTDGSISLNGSVKNLFEAQWMMNHTVKSIKDQLDLASKLIFQTSDGNFVGQNALSAIESGDILIHATNQPLTQVNNNSHDITSLQAFGNQWKALSSEINGISESMLGNTAPSGTAWRQVEALLNESHSLFELMTENKGLCIERMLRERIIPFWKKKLKNRKELSATLDAHDISRIDSMYIKGEVAKRVNSKMVDSIIEGKEISPEEQDQLVQSEQSSIQDSLSSLGNQRFFVPSEMTDKTWHDILGMLDKVEVDVTGENTDKDAATTLNTLLMFFAKKQGQPMTPEEKLVINKILNLTGTVSPLELSSIPQTPPIQPQIPAQVGGGGGALPANVA